VSIITPSTVGVYFKKTRIAIAVKPPVKAGIITSKRGDE